MASSSESDPYDDHANTNVYNTASNIPADTLLDQCLSGDAQVFYRFALHGPKPVTLNAFKQPLEYVPDRNVSDVCASLTSFITKHSLEEEKLLHYGTLARKQIDQARSNLAAYHRVKQRVLNGEEVLVKEHALEAIHAYLTESEDAVTREVAQYSFLAASKEDQARKSRDALLAGIEASMETIPHIIGNIPCPFRLFLLQKFLGECALTNDRLLAEFSALEPQGFSLSYNPDEASASVLPSVQSTASASSKIGKSAPSDGSQRKTSATISPQRKELNKDKTSIQEVAEPVASEVSKAQSYVHGASTFFKAYINILRRNPTALAAVVQYIDAGQPLVSEVPQADPQKTLPLDDSPSARAGTPVKGSAKSSVASSSGRPKSRSSSPVSSPIPAMPEANPAETYQRARGIDAPFKPSALHLARFSDFEGLLQQYQTPYNFFVQSFSAERDFLTDLRREFAATASPDIQQLIAESVSASNEEFSRAYPQPTASNVIRADTGDKVALPKIENLESLIDFLRFGAFCIGKAYSLEREKCRATFERQEAVTGPESADIPPENCSQEGSLTPASAHLSSLTLQAVEQRVEALACVFFTGDPASGKTIAAAELNFRLNATDRVSGIIDARAEMERLTGLVQEFLVKRSETPKLPSDGVAVEPSLVVSLSALEEYMHSPSAVGMQSPRIVSGSTSLDASAPSGPIAEPVMPGALHSDHKMVTKLVSELLRTRSADESAQTSANDGESLSDGHTQGGETIDLADAEKVTDLLVQTFLTQSFTMALLRGYDTLLFDGFPGSPHELLIAERLLNGRVLPPGTNGTREIAHSVPPTSDEDAVVQSNIPDASTSLFVRRTGMTAMVYFHTDDFETLCKRAHGRLFVSSASVADSTNNVAIERLNFMNSSRLTVLSPDSSAHTAKDAAKKLAVSVRSQSLDTRSVDELFDFEALMCNRADTELLVSALLDRRILKSVPCASLAATQEFRQRFSEYISSLYDGLSCGISLPPSLLPLKTLVLEIPVMGEIAGDSKAKGDHTANRSTKMGSVRSSHSQTTSSAAARQSDAAIPVSIPDDSGVVDLQVSSGVIPISEPGDATSLGKELCEDTPVSIEALSSVLLHVNSAELFPSGGSGARDTKEQESDSFLQNLQTVSERITSHVLKLMTPSRPCIPCGLASPENLGSGRFAQSLLYTYRAQMSIPHKSIEELLDEYRKEIHTYSEMKSDPKVKKPPVKPPIRKTAEDATIPVPNPLFFFQYSDDALSMITKFFATISDAAASRVTHLNHCVADSLAYMALCAWVLTDEQRMLRDLLASAVNETTKTVETIFTGFVDYYAHIHDNAKTQESVKTDCLLIVDRCITESGQVIACGRAGVDTILTLLTEKYLKVGAKMNIRLLDTSIDVLQVGTSSTPCSDHTIETDCDLSADVTYDPLLKEAIDTFLTLNLRTREVGSLVGITLLRTVSAILDTFAADIWILHLVLFHLVDLTVQMARDTLTHSGLDNQSIVFIDGGDSFRQFVPQKAQKGMESYVSAVEASRSIFLAQNPAQVASIMKSRISTRFESMDSQPTLDTYISTYWVVLNDVLASTRTLASCFVVVQPTTGTVQNVSLHSVFSDAVAAMAGNIAERASLLRTECLGLVRQNTKGLASVLSEAIFETNRLFGRTSSLAASLAKALQTAVDDGSSIGGFVIDAEASSIRLQMAAK